jgi:hypothetical protein
MTNVRFGSSTIITVTSVSTSTVLTVNFKARKAPLHRSCKSLSEHQLALALAAQSFVRVTIVQPVILAVSTVFFQCKIKTSIETSNPRVPCGALPYRCPWSTAATAQICPFGTLSSVSRQRRALLKIWTRARHSLLWSRCRAIHQSKEQESLFIPNWQRCFYTDPALHETYPDGSMLNDTMHCCRNLLLFRIL